jgi:uncharacterized protein
MSKVLLFGAGGNVGRAVTEELLNRGHQVTAASRTGRGVHPAHPLLTVVAGDARDPNSVAELAPGHDAVASTVGPRLGVEDDREVIVGATRGLIDGLRKAGVDRLVVLGGAGSLRTPDGSALVDSPHFPSMWKANATAQAEALSLYREVDDLAWTFVSPAAHLEPGDRTEVFRIGGDELLTDQDGNSCISIPDFAIAVVDQIVSGTAIRRRISVAY